MLLLKRKKVKRTAVVVSIPKKQCFILFENMYVKTVRNIVKIL